MIGFFMAYLVDSLTGVGLVDQMGNFFYKTLLFVAIVGVLVIRKNEDLDNIKKLIEETTFYDQPWLATSGPGGKWNLNPRADLSSPIARPPHACHKPRHCLWSLSKTHVSSQGLFPALQRCMNVALLLLVAGCNKPACMHAPSPLVFMHVRLSLFLLMHLC